jgi:hypothetical protein
MHPIDYDLIRKRAHRMRREAIADLLRRAAAKLRTVVAPDDGVSRQPPFPRPRRC